MPELSQPTWNFNNVRRNELNSLPIEQSPCINNPVLTNDAFFSVILFNVLVSSLVEKCIACCEQRTEEISRCCALQANMMEITTISKLTNVVPLLSKCDL